MVRTVQGMTYAWQVGDKPIGSGDAGEVYTVTCLDQPNLTGMLKKPARVATVGTLQRQADQIAREAHALIRLEGLPDSKARPPRLLDQAPEYTQGTANFFIISETAPGEDFTSLLMHSRQTGKPFPRRVIISVLDALFDMFSRAHKAGVLWNDVKLDHIYWHNESGLVGVIDWGNALFLEGEQQHGRPRWEDYQQLVDTLGNFLQTSAPELYTDLGWDEFQGQTLDSPRVSILARRISYQQQVIALQVMEFQSLIRVVLSADPSIDGLRKIIEYKHILEKIGASWAHADVLHYCQALIESALAEGDRQSTVSTTTLVWELFDDSLDLPWHLLREYCRHTDILTHSAYPALVKHTLSADWTATLWAASTIANQVTDPVWWNGLIPVIRQKALNTTEPTPYQTCQTVLTWAKDQNDRNLVEQLTAIIKGWRHKGEDLQESPLDYDLLDILRENHGLPSRLRSELKQSFAPGEEAIRGLVKVWTNANWDDLPKALQLVLSWDPDRWGILCLATQVKAFQAWLKTLFDGPAIGVSPLTFLEKLLADRPKIELLLGTPPWISGLVTMLNQVTHGESTSTLQSEINHYAPWLLPYHNILLSEARKAIIDETTIHTQLIHFTGHLKNWSDVDTGLAEIFEHSRSVYPACRKLTDGFRSILSLNTDLQQLKARSTEAVLPELAEGFQTMQSLLAWREKIDNQDLSGAVSSLKKAESHGWVLAAHANQVTRQWHDCIHPVLSAMRSFTAPPDPDSNIPDHDFGRLLEISSTCAEIPAFWSQIYRSGIHAQLLETLEAATEMARSSFIEWRAEIENTSDQAVRLIYHSQLDIIRQISSNLMRITQHIRQAKLSFAALGEGDQASPSMQISSIENILYHLAGLEAEFIPNPDERRFPEYHHTFKHAVEAQTGEARRSIIDALPKDHPFYAWLVKSSLA